MNDQICPVCGGSDIIKKQKEETIKEPFGGQKAVLLNECMCQTCGSTGDFFNENEVSIQSSLSELKRASVVNILNEFVQNKYSLSSMERALELPQRTLSKWKNGVTSPSSTGIALFKILHTFPWLLEVAENKYDHISAQKIHINVALSEVLQILNFNEGISSVPGTGSTGGRGMLFFEFGNTNNATVSDADIYSEPNTICINDTYSLRNSNENYQLLSL